MSAKIDLIGLYTLLQDPQAQRVPIEHWFNETAEALYDAIHDNEYSAMNPIQQIAYRRVCGTALYLLENWLEFDDSSAPTELTEALSYYFETVKIPLNERQFDENEKRWIVYAYNHDPILAAATQEEVAIYKRLATALYEQGDRYGLLAVGYGCYGGNRAFECDFERARQCMHQLLESDELLQNKAFYANTLGYIYYYGRTNNGIPRYEEAFRYFNFAAHARIYEARYKLADLYKHGRGTEKNEELAHALIRTLYEETLPQLINGEFDSKFADIALRMGNYAAEQEPEEDGDAEDVLNYYLQADFALRMRRHCGDSYGDDTVAKAIHTTLERTKQEMGFRPKKSLTLYNLSRLLSRNLLPGRWMEVTVKEKRHNYKLTFCIHQRQDERISKRVFLSVPELELCGLYDRVSVTLDTAGTLPLGTFLFDELYTDALYFDGGTVLKFPEDAVFRFVAPADTKIHRFAAVTFDGERQYDYRCPDETVSEGNTVLVEHRGKEKRAQIARIYCKKESELALPLKSYHSILSKA
ncbi:MAG: sel1 repeat family protein [Clostridia bacterium]|nr:sel1 repeat family protein [Clostridia bacterium]